MRNALYGALAGVLVFAALSWTTERKTVHAAVLTAPHEGRFEIAREQGANGATEGVFLLDTETGCVWNNTPVPLSSKLKPNGSNSATYLIQGGGVSFSILPFDTAKFVPPVISAGQMDYSGATRELEREERLCDQARVRALVAAAR